MEMRVACLACGEPFEGVDATQVLNQKLPCSHCGEQTYKIDLLVQETIAGADDRVSVGVSASGDLTAADRLKHVRNSLDTLNDISSADLNWIAVARHKLHDAYVNLWAMREACINEGVALSTVDRAIDGDLDVEYAIDLGNAAKHGTPLRRVRSGKQPAFGDFQATMDGEMWWIDETVLFDGQPRSGVTVARAALGGWERNLHTWGLI